MRSPSSLNFAAAPPVGAPAVPTTRPMGRAAPMPDRRTLSSDVEHLLLMDRLPQLGMLLSTVLRAAALHLAALGFEVDKQPLRQPRTLPNGRVIALEVAVSFRPPPSSGAVSASAKKFLVRAGVMVRVGRGGEWESDLLLWACSPARSASAWPGLSTGSTPFSLTLSTDQFDCEEFRTLGDMRAAMNRLEAHIDRGGASVDEIASDFAENLLSACKPRRAS